MKILQQVQDFHGSVRLLRSPASTRAPATLSQEWLWRIAYDRPSNKRRRKLAKLLEDYGQRLPWNEFECRLQAQQQQRLSRKLAGTVTSGDSIRIWAVPQWAPAAEQLGNPVEITPWQDKVI